VNFHDKAHSVITATVGTYCGSGSTAKRCNAHHPSRCNRSRKLRQKMVDVIPIHNAPNLFFRRSISDMNRTAKAIVTAVLLAALGGAVFFALRGTQQEKLANGQSPTLSLPGLRGQQTVELRSMWSRFSKTCG
jgi:hypothetical protein